MKKVIIGIIIAIIVIICGYSYIKPMINDMTRPNDIKNFLNKKSFKNISEDTVKRFKYGEELVEEYDVSDLITNYIECITKSVEAKYEGKKYLLEDRPFSVGSSSGIGVLTKNGLENYDLEAIYDLIDDEIMRKYEKGYFTQYLKEELYKAIEGKIEHKGDYLYTGYFIKPEQEMDIDLPFNCALYYRPYKKVKYDNRECVNVKIAKKIENRNSEVEFYVDYYDKDKILHENKPMYLEFKNKGLHKDDMTINIYGWFYGIEQSSSASISCKSREDWQ